MQCNNDTQFIKVLNDQGISITWEQFTQAYKARKKQRDAAIAKSLKNASDPLKPSRVTEASIEAMFLDRL